MDDLSLPLPGVGDAAIMAGPRSPHAHAAGAPALDTAQWGMIAFLGSEVAFFSTLVVAYIALLGQDKVGPTPREALSLPLVLFTTLCLLSSSVTMHGAVKQLVFPAAFVRWWGATIALGLIFLLGTAFEWRELINVHHLTLSRNLFGTTYYTLVGFHALHVSIGVLLMALVLGLVARRELSSANHKGVELVAWYWHFVDAVWVVVFTVVYLIGR